jgi:hypothetical protein
LELAEEIDQIMTEIREIEKSIELEKEIIDGIKIIKNNNKKL